MAYRDLQDPRNLEAKRRHYYANKEAYIARSKVNKERNRIFIDELKDRPCVDCGGIFPPCAMDFDHVADNKERNIAAMVGSSQRLILEEVAKCELVCANCHRVRTWMRGV
jgi:hypothetical protein